MRKVLVLGLGACLVAAVAAGLVRLDREVARRAAAIREPETGMVVEARDGAILRTFAASDGRWRLAVGEGDVDPRFLRMLEGWEDKRFRTHGGIDPVAMGRAVWSAVWHGRLVSGGSTLTMQTARLLQRLPTGSWRAKGEQALGALALERALGKSEILDLYLQLAPYGGAIEGVRAASLGWFGHEPRRLTAGEAALLVALPQSPERLRPDLHPERARRARDRVLDRMAEIGILSREEVAAARREPVPTARRAMPMLAAHAAQRARDEARLRHEAYPHRLTIDAALQARLEAYACYKAATLPAPESLAILVADHRTGEILASVGSPGLLDAARDGHVDLTLSARSPGSTLKPLIYGIAFERGLAHPESLMDDRPRSFAGYTPGNFDHLFEGTLTARRALQLSRNLPAVELLAAVGPSRLVDRMRRAGAAPELGSRTLPGLAIGLGGLGLSLRDLVRIYGGIANGGVAEPLHIETASAGRDERGARILSAQASWYLASILAGAPGTVKASPGTVAYKTGTSFGYRDAWTLAFDGRYVVGIWLGRPDGAPVPGLVGQEAAVPVMRDVFARLGMPVPLPGPPPGILADARRLPPALRRIAPGGPASAGADAPEIVFPPPDTQVELANGTGTLALKLRNGRPPFTWYVDGRPALSNLYAREASWHPAEPGFLTISVVDAAGGAATTRVLVR